MDKVYVVVMQDDDNDHCLAAYPSRDVAELHAKLLNDLRDRVVTMDNDLFEAIARQDVPLWPGNSHDCLTDTCASCRVEELPFCLHPDQFLERRENSG